MATANHQGAQAVPPSAAGGPLVGVRVDTTAESSPTTVMWVMRNVTCQRVGSFAIPASNGTAQQDPGGRVSRFTILTRGAPDGIGSGTSVVGDLGRQPAP